MTPAMISMRLFSYHMVGDITKAKVTPQHPTQAISDCIALNLYEIFCFVAACLQDLVNFWASQHLQISTLKIPFGHQFLDISSNIPEWRRNFGACQSNYSLIGHAFIIEIWKKWNGFDFPSISLTTSIKIVANQLDDSATIMFNAKDTRSTTNWIPPMGRS